MKQKHQFKKEKYQLINYKQKLLNYHCYKNQIYLTNYFYKKINYLQKTKNLLKVLKSKKKDLFIGLMRKEQLLELNNLFKLLKKMIKSRIRNKHFLPTQPLKKLLKTTWIVIMWNLSFIVGKNKKKKKGRNLQNRRPKRKKRWGREKNRKIMFTNKRTDIRRVELGLIQ